MLDRRQFIRQVGVTAAFTGVSPSMLAGNEVIKDFKSINAAPLKEHRLQKIEKLMAKYHYPRLVGRNSKRDINGKHKKEPCLRITTDQGASGWATFRGRCSQELIDSIKGKTVDELFSIDQGIRNDSLFPFDLALHDLAGVILNKPVYELLGAHGPKSTDVYSGMIYFDELDKDAKPQGLDRVMANCKWDYDYGYRQLKVKIGRSGKWYPHAEGLATDIKLVRMIHEAYADKGVMILVDANDAYSLEDTIAFLQGVKNVPLFWIEEPFLENLESSRKLKKWMMENGREKTYYSDGEYKPKFELIDKLIGEGTLDMHLVDIASYGFTRWRKMMPRLIEKSAVASPHTWGSMLKTHYVSHLSAGLGNIPTIEGVTCLSDEIDYGDYQIINGKLKVSDRPGFGMKLLI